MWDWLEAPRLRVLRQSGEGRRTVLSLVRRARRQPKESAMSGFSMTSFESAGQSFVVDPVCEIKVNPEHPPAKIVVQGRTYYFCSELCKRLFEREPGKYIGAVKD